MIKGYDKDANISLINVMYHKPKKNQETGKYDTGSLDIMYKDMNTNDIKHQHIKDPSFIYYMVNDDIQDVTYNRLFIEKEKTYPVMCKYRELKKDMAKRTDNLEFFYDNIRSGNYRENDRLFTIPRIFSADINIEDFYRQQFNRRYRNTPFIPDRLYFDIEADTIEIGNRFPQPGECPVNAITLVNDNNETVYTLLLNNDKNPLIEEFKNTKGIIDELKQFIEKEVGGWKNLKRFKLDNLKYKILFYDEEIALINDCFNIINTFKPTFALAWNIAFDLPYLIERIKILGYSPEEIICHKDFEVKEAWYYVDKNADEFSEKGDYSQVSSYTTYIDQMIQFASRRKGQQKLPRYTLDYIGELIAGVKKLDYSHITTKISELPYKDYKTFVFYNIMDTIVQKCIEVKIDDIGYMYNKSLLDNTRYSKCHRQSVYLKNRTAEEFWNMGYVLGNNVNIHNEKVGFPGAFNANPDQITDKPKLKINGHGVDIYDNLDDFDYKSLYPSNINENNISPNTQIGKIILPNQIDPKENRFNNNYFDRVVNFVEDFTSGNILEFCSRYLNLGSYEDVYDDIIEYFNTVKNAIYGLKLRDVLTGNRIICHKVDNKKKRTLCHKVDNTQKRQLVYRSRDTNGIDFNRFNNN